MELFSIPENDVLEAIKIGEFPSSVINSESKVVIIFTQDWCGQGNILQNYLIQMDQIPGLKIYLMIYNLESWFEEFLFFKENSFKNDQIPYLRYYNNGKLYKESNFVTLNLFLKNCGLD